MSELCKAMFILVLKHETTFVKASTTIFSWVLSGWSKLNALHHRYFEHSTLFLNNNNKIATQTQLGRERRRRAFWAIVFFLLLLLLSLVLWQILLENILSWTNNGEAEAIMLIQCILTQHKNSLEIVKKQKFLSFFSEGFVVVVFFRPFFLWSKCSINSSVSKWACMAICLEYDNV